MASPIYDRRDILPWKSKLPLGHEGPQYGPHSVVVSDPLNAVGDPAKRAALQLEREALLARTTQSEKENTLTERRFGLDEQKLAQDKTQHAEAIKASMANHILSLAGSRPDVPLDIFAETAKAFGFPEVHQSLLAAHDKELTGTADKLRGALVAAKGSGDTDTYTQLLETVKAHPQSKDILPKIQASLPKEYEGIKLDLDPKKPGVQTSVPSEYANDPEFKALQPLIQAEEARKKAEEATKSKNQAAMLRRGTLLNTKDRAGLLGDVTRPGEGKYIPSDIDLYEMSKARRKK